MLDKEKLGTRYTCFTCGTKFYDLNRPVPTCPECSADQREAPARDIRALLAGKGPIGEFSDEESDSYLEEDIGDEDDEDDADHEDEDDDMMDEMDV